MPEQLLCNFEQHPSSTDCCSAYDIEDKVIGTVGAGRIGQRVLQRLQVCHCAFQLFPVLVLPDGQTTSVRSDLAEFDGLSLPQWTSS